MNARVARYRSAIEPVPLAGRTVLVVDDGLATGATARAALRAARATGAKRVVLAAPVVARATVEALHEETNEIVCVQQARHLGGRLVV